MLNTLVLLQVLGQTVPAGLVDAMAAGNASAMSEYFHQSLELSILDEDYESSKNQATRILESFFKKHKPTDFKVSFEGTKEKSKYAIGTLSAADGSYRVNLFFINKGGKRLIYYLSIEKESRYELLPGP